MSTCALRIFDLFSKPSKTGTRSDRPMPLDWYQWLDSPEWNQFLNLSVYVVYAHVPVSDSVGR